MLTLGKPTVDAVALYERCANGYRDVGLKARLLSVRADIGVAAAEYERQGGALGFHLISETDGIANTVTTTEMCNLYDVKLAAQRSPGRPVYDEIMSAAPRGICPLCGQRQAATLDHYLPKRRFPAFAVLPINLVPACRDCNTIKLAAIASRAEEQTFHPYYDDWGPERWLTATVVQASAPSLRFGVRAPSGWPRQRAERAENHLDAFDLRRLYAVHAAEELVMMRSRLCDLQASAGNAGIRAHLQEEAVSRVTARPNSWQAATYAALAASDWFCREGFERIPQP